MAHPQEAKVVRGRDPHGPVRPPGRGGGPRPVPRAPRLGDGPDIRSRRRRDPVLTRALVLVSGGIDSAVALWWARERYSVTALSFDGARRPRGEVRACRAIVRRARVPHLNVPLPFLEPSADGYVPGRNLVYHAAAISIAERRGAKAVVA